MWYWCFSCNKVFKSVGDKPSVCPHCEAPAKNLWIWEEILEIHPEYPRKPKSKGVYRLNIKRGLGEVFEEGEVI